MAIPAIPIIDGLVKLAQQWLEGRAKQAEARADRKSELIRQQGSWEEIMAQGSQTSWKDEYLLILFSIPLILAFVPPAVPVVLDGFAALREMPDWYIRTIGIIVAASFGVRSAISLYSGFGRARVARDLMAKAEDLKRLESTITAVEKSSADTTEIVKGLVGK